MTIDELKALTLEGFERMFNQGELDFVDATARPVVDHQEPGNRLPAHLKHVISTLEPPSPTWLRRPRADL